jgi:shikimate dehydrogenase
MPSPARLTLCGSLSLHPVGLGAAMHLAGYRALGLAFTYVPFGVTDLEGAIGGMRALGIRGLGISMPFKQQVVPLLDGLDPLAARIGAVNTVVNDGGRLTGHNTDSSGAVRALEEVGPLRRKRVLLLGAGGAARAIAHGVAERGVELCIANRDLERARTLAHEVGATAKGLDEAEHAGDYDVVVNATSVGMNEVDPGSPVPERAIHAGQAVMDIVYKPIETALVRAARRAGAETVHGGRMLLYQAARQFELYTGHDAPLEAMDAALRAAMAEGF